MEKPITKDVKEDYKDYKDNCI